MSVIKISIEVRIEAANESAARQYAVAHGIDVTYAKWYRNCDGKDGRLYAVATTPFFSPQLPAMAAAGMCGGRGPVNKFCTNPVHKILHSGTDYSEWQCESCGGKRRTTLD